MQCRREGKTTRAATVDHIRARMWMDSTDEQRNLEPLCKFHNSSKAGRDVSPYGPAPLVAGNGRPISARFR